MLHIHIALDASRGGDNLKGSGEFGLRHWSLIQTVSNLIPCQIFVWSFLLTYLTFTSINTIQLRSLVRNHVSDDWGTCLSCRWDVKNMSVKFCLNTQLIHYSHENEIVMKLWWPCATSQKVVGSIPNEVIGYFNWPNLSSCNVTLGST
jgi:hypothetical protein